jgi:hypothetical protein
MYRAFSNLKRVSSCTYKLHHHFLNSSAAVYTEDILYASDHSTESVPAQKHPFKSSRFRFHPFPLQEGPLSPAGLERLADRGALLPRRPRRPCWPPPQRSTQLPNRRSVGRTCARDGHLRQRSRRYQHGPPLAPTVLTIHRAVMDLSWSRMCCGDVDIATKKGECQSDPDKDDDNVKEDIHKNHQLDDSMILTHLLWIHCGMPRGRPIA